MFELKENTGCQLNWITNNLHVMHRRSWIRRAEYSRNIFSGYWDWEEVKWSEVPHGPWCAVSDLSPVFKIDVWIQTADSTYLVCVLIGTELTDEVAEARQTHESRRRNQQTIQEQDGKNHKPSPVNTTTLHACFFDKWSHMQQRKLSSVFFFCWSGVL